MNTQYQIKPEEKDNVRDENVNNYIEKDKQNLRINKTEPKKDNIKIIDNFNDFLQKIEDMEIIIR